MFHNSKGESLQQFRKHVIRSSLFPETNLPKAIERLSFLQADPIRCPARAQDLILRQRVKQYKAGHLEKCYPDLNLEECFLFAYGFAPKVLWDLIYPKTISALSALDKQILSAIGRLGSTDSRGLEAQIGAKRVTNYWGGSSRKAKMCLESLHDRGHLRVSHRENGIRFYALARIPQTDRSKPERFKEILLITLRAIGPTTRRFLLSELAQFKYLLNEVKARRACLQELIDSDRIRIDLVDAVEYISASDQKPSRVALDRVRILAPFDPIVRDRARFEHLWGWTYRFEAYTPPAKRKLGYYAMPVLWRDQMVGWANTKVNDGQLSVQFGFIFECPKEKAFHQATEHEVARMAEFLELDKSAFSL
ncbi:MAG: crosslink repair DNA glycosylase YcaQ family protein [Verrucomicrobiota bacterium]